MLLINRKSSLGHWYAPVFAPDFPRDPPEIHGCTLLSVAKAVPIQGMASSVGRVKIPACGPE